MTAQCNATKLIFHELKTRGVVGRFDGGEITSDAGGMLLREVEKRTGILSLNCPGNPGAVQVSRQRPCDIGTPPRHRHTPETRRWRRPNHPSPTTTKP